MHQIHTCVELLQQIEAKDCNKTALNSRYNDVWRAMSTEEFLQSVKDLALGLIDMGLQKGERVGVLASASSYWTVAHLAIMVAGGVTVPLFASISDEHFEYEVKQTDIKLIFVDGVDQLEMFHRHASLFNQAITFSLENVKTKIISLSEVCNNGKRFNEEHPNFYHQLQAAVLPNQLAMIIYTSGSTGIPKGVELTQENITCQLHNDPYHWDVKHDRYLSVLPLEHIFGASVNLWLLYWGVSIYYTADYKNIGVICREVQPTCIVLVPRLLEKIHESMIGKIDILQGLKYLLGKYALRLAHQEKLKVWQKALITCLDPIVYSKLRVGLGGKLRVVISGGAPLDPLLHQFFERIKVPIYEGWGMTEACPACVNLPENNKAGTVGPPLKGISLQISPSGEILVKGALVMKGYYRDPEATKKTLDSEGWLHTGDRGLIDESGRLVILGRIKELYKTSTGEYVAPIPIEQALCRHPLIEAAMVVAEGKKYTTVLLFASPQSLERMKIKHESEKFDDGQFLKGAFVATEMNKLIESINEKLNHAEQIRSYRFILKPLSVKDGELTPSMKIRREVLTKKYREIIDTMYREGSV